MHRLVPVPAASSGGDSSTSHDRAFASRAVVQEMQRGRIAPLDRWETVSSDVFIYIFISVVPSLFFCQIPRCGLRAWVMCPCGRPGVPDLMLGGLHLSHEHTGEVLSMKRDAERGRDDDSSRLIVFVLLTYVFRTVTLL